MGWQQKHTKMSDQSESCKTKHFSRKKEVCIFLLLSQFSWIANYIVQLLAENDFGIRKIDGGKYSTLFWKDCRENAYSKHNIYIKKSE